MIKAIAKHDFVHNHLHPKRGEVVEGLSENTLKELEKNGLVHIFQDVHNKIAAALTVPPALLIEKKPPKAVNNKSQAKSVQQVAKVDGATLPNDTEGSDESAGGGTDSSATGEHQGAASDSASTADTQSEQPGNTVLDDGTGASTQNDQSSSTGQES